MIDVLHCHGHSALFIIAATSQVPLSTIDQSASYQCKLDIHIEHLRISMSAIGFLQITFLSRVTSLCPMLSFKCYSST